jgi:hypothetical protein
VKNASIHKDAYLEGFENALKHPFTSAFRDNNEPCSEELKRLEKRLIENFEYPISVFVNLQRYWLKELGMERPLTILPNSVILLPKKDDERTHLNNLRNRKQSQRHP